MSTADDGTNLDPATIDLDAWIDGIVRPEVTVELYPHEYDYQQRIKALEKQIDALDRDADRSIEEPSPEVLMAQIQELRAERSRTALRVRLRQPLQAEMVEATIRANAENVPEADWPFWQVATACVEPAFTPDQLKRLCRRDRSGEAMWGQLFAAVNELLKGLPVPS